MEQADAGCHGRRHAAARLVCLAERHEAHATRQRPPPRLHRHKEAKQLFGTVASMQETARTRRRTGETSREAWRSVDLRAAVY